MLPRRKWFLVSGLAERWRSSWKKASFSVGEVDNERKSLDEKSMELVGGRVSARRADLAERAERARDMEVWSGDFCGGAIFWRMMERMLNNEIMKELDLCRHCYTSKD